MADRDTEAKGRHLFALCLTAGFVDAFGYFELGRIFPANMSGNTVFLGISLASADWPRVLTSVMTIGTFFLGAVAAGLLRRWSGTALLLVIAAALLAPVDAVDMSRRLELFLLAFGMGVQGASLSRFGPVRLQTVVVTGNLLKLAQGVAAGAGRGAILLPSGSWGAYAAGAALHILLSRPSAGAPLALPAVLLLLVAGDLARSRRRRS